MYKFRATKYCVLEPNIYESSGYSLLLGTLLEPRILMFILHFFFFGKSVSLLAGVFFYKRDQLPFSQNPLH